MDKLTYALAEKYGPTLTPPADDIQNIHVRHDPATGKLDITFPVSMSADEALGLLGDTIYYIYASALKEKASFPVSAFGKVCIQVEDGNLSMAFGLGKTPTTLSADPVKAKGLLVAAWLALCERTAKGEFDPRAALVEGFRL